MMRRRKFLITIGGAFVWPFAVRAQLSKRLPTIGLLTAGTPSSHGSWVVAFVERLRELGWIEDRTIAFEYRWAEGRNDRYAEIAAEFVRLNVDAIVTQGGATVVAKNATSIIPIIFSAVSDPIATGLVASLGRPGGNVTGLSLQFPDHAGKRLELLREAVPGLSVLAVLANVASPITYPERDKVQALARELGIEVIALQIRRAEDIAPAFDVLRDRDAALYVVPDPLVTTNQVHINNLALDARLATMHPLREYVVSGGLMSYGANFPELFRRAADFVDRILRGAKPSDLPVEQPTKFDLVINMTTAKALRLAISPILLARASELIE